MTENTTTAHPAPDPLDVRNTLSPLRKEYCHSIFTTALEGGIGYWSQCTEYRWMKPGADRDGKFEDICDYDNFHAVIVPPEAEGCWGVFDDDNPSETGPLTISLATIDHGLKLMVKYCRGEINGLTGAPIPEAEQKPLADAHPWRSFLAQEATNGREGDSDADVADWVVQFGLFGKGIYG